MIAGMCYSCTRCNVFAGRLVQAQCVKAAWEVTDQILLVVDIAAIH